ncbi:MAG TPA: rRNA maturation RNase YbeY [Dehalococcoidia bacterium]|nr:rRNA maturation RNase YbeY [Dehalococcoidia bacterium]
MPVRHVIEVDVRPEYALRLDPSLLRAAVTVTLASRRLRAPRAISVTITDTRTVQRLNKRYLGDDKPTDVLSFNVDIPGLRRPDRVIDLGALIVALPVAARGARERGVDLADEIALLLTHGTLHLLGFDHETRPDDAAMRELERKALLRLGRPHAARDPA